MTGFTRVHELLSQHLVGFPWQVVISDWQGRAHAVGGEQPHWCGHPLRIHFRNERPIKDLLALNGLGVLEGFVRGDLDLSGNLYALPFFKQYLNLNLSSGQTLAALVRNRYAQTVDRARLNVKSHYDIPQQMLELYLDRAYMSYSCGMFDAPDDLDVGELSRAGQGEPG